MIKLFVDFVSPAFVPNEVEDVNNAPKNEKPMRNIEMALGFRPKTIGDSISNEIDQSYLEYLRVNHIQDPDYPDSLDFVDTDASSCVDEKIEGDNISAESIEDHVDAEQHLFANRHSCRPREQTTG